MIVRTMEIEERIERKGQTSFRLRKTNATPFLDDILDLVILTGVSNGEPVPTWKVGDTVTIEVKQ